MNPKSLAVKIPVTILLLFAALTFANAQTGPPRRFNDAFVLRALTQIHGAEMTYSATHGNGQYGTLAQLGQAGFIDAALATGEKYGNVFALSITGGPPQTPASFYVTATPRVYRKTGLRSFYISMDGEFRGGDLGGRVATASDPLFDFDLCTTGGIADNERCTLEDLRSVHGAQMTYAATIGNGNYSLFPDLYQARLIRRDLADYSSRGYSYSVAIWFQFPGQPARFTVTATPQIYGTSGIRSFFVDQTGVLRGADRQGRPADQNDPPIE